jgi:hypothetical protein
MRTFSICPQDWSDELSVADAIAAIRASFPLAVIDAEQGRTRAQQVLDRLRSLNAPAVVQEVYVKGSDEAVMVSLHEPSSTPFMLIPGEGIQLRSTDESVATRLAKTLGYECVEIG